MRYFNYLHRSNCHHLCHIHEVSAVSIRSVQRPKRSGYGNKDESNSSKDVNSVNTKIYCFENLSWTTRELGISG